MENIIKTFKNILVEILFKLPCELWKQRIFS